MTCLQLTYFIVRRMRPARILTLREELAFLSLRLYGSGFLLDVLDRHTHSTKESLFLEMVIKPLVHFRELQRIYDPYAWVLEDAEELVTRLLGGQHKTSVQTGHMPGRRGGKYVMRNTIRATCRAPPPQQSRGENSLRLRWQKSGMFNFAERYGVLEYEKKSQSHSRVLRRKVASRGRHLSRLVWR